MLEQHLCVSLATQGSCLVQQITFPACFFFSNDFQRLCLSSLERQAHFNFGVVGLACFFLLLMLILRGAGTLLLPEFLRELLVDDSVEWCSPAAIACTRVSST